MKNYILLFALLVLPITEAASQETEQKLYVPEKGDYSIAVDVPPVLNYVGNIFNGTNNNQIGDISGKPVTSEIEGFNIDNIAPDVSIMGRYMYTDNFAFKANVGLMMRTNTSREYVKDDIASVNDPLTNSKLIDRRNIKRNGLSAMLGCEYRKGSKRLQGVFGAGVILGFNRSATRYNYGNEMTAINQYPTSSWNTYTSGYRTLVNKSSSNFFFGAAASAGVEYFIAQKISLGVEMNLAAYYVVGGQEYITSEGYNAIKGVVETKCDIKNPGSRALRFGTENLGGSLYLAFYF